MPFVVNEIAQSESNYEADDVFSAQHFSEGTRVEDMGKFFLENFRSYARSEKVRHKKTYRAEQSNG
jgi:hypothetical protein